MTKEYKDWFKEIWLNEFYPINPLTLEELQEKCESIKHPSHIYLSFDTLDFMLKERGFAAHRFQNLCFNGVPIYIDDSLPIHDCVILSYGGAAFRPGPQFHKIRNPVD